MNDNEPFTITEVEYEESPLSEECVKRDRTLMEEFFLDGKDL